MTNEAHFMNSTGNATGNTTQSPASPHAAPGGTGQEVPPSQGSSAQNFGRASQVFGKTFSEKEQKRLFLYLVIGIVLMEMAVTVGALVYSITGAERLPSGMMRFHFPWIGYLVSVVLVPALVMLVIHLLSLGFTRTLEGDGTRDFGAGGEGAVSGRVGTFYALVRGAPTVILFAGFVLMGAAVYYLDGVMALLLKLGDSFQTVAIWLVAALAGAWTVSTVVRMFLVYKSRQMEAEYAFRREVLERTGMVILEAKHMPTTELRMLPSPVGQSEQGGHNGNSTSDQSALEAKNALVDTLPERLT